MSVRAFDPRWLGDGINVSNSGSGPLITGLKWSTPARGLQQAWIIPTLLPDLQDLAFKPTFKVSVSVYRTKLSLRHVGARCSWSSPGN